MSNYDPMLESQRFSAEVTQRGQSEANQMQQRSMEHLAGTVRSVSQANADRGERAREFDASMEQRQGEQKQAQQNFEREFAQRQASLAEQVRQHTEQFSLEQRKFEQAQRFAEIEIPVQQEILKRKQLENQAFDLDIQKETSRAALEDARLGLQARRLELRRLEQQMAAEQAAGMEESERMQWAQTVGERLFGGPDSGEIGPTPAGVGASRALAAASNVNRSRMSRMLGDLSKSIGDADPGAAAAITGIGLQLESGAIDAKQAKSMLDSMFAADAVRELGGAPMDQKKLETAISKLPDRAREIHERLDPGLPFGNAARLRLSLWIERNMDGIMQSFSLRENPSRPIDRKSKDAQDRAVADLLRALSPRDPRHDMMVRRLMELGAFTQSDIQEYAAMRGEAERNDPYGYKTGGIRL